MTAPERHLPTATTRAIVRENLIEHLIQASRRAFTGPGMDRGSAEKFADELLDVSYRIEHQARGDRIRVTLNPPQVGTPLPEADGREHVIEAGGWTAGPTPEQRQQDYTQPLVSAGSGRAQLDQIAGEVTADGSTVLPPTTTVGADEQHPVVVALGPDLPAGLTQCDTWSAGVRCRYALDPDTGKHEGDHTFGGGMGDPVHLKHCGDRDGHPAHAWRPNAGKGEPFACSGLALDGGADYRPADVVLTGPEGIGTEGDGSPDDVAATGVDFTPDQGDEDRERASVPPADFE